MNGTVTICSVDDRNALSGGSSAPPYSYDGNGNLTSKGQGSGITQYVYDDENRLIRLIYGSTYKTEYAYDGLGRLRVRTEYLYSAGWYVASTTRYIYDGMRVVQERNGSNTPLVGYTRGKDLSGTLEGAGGIGGLLARSSGYSGGSWPTHHFYDADGNGNVTRLVTTTLTTAASYKYDPYGRTISSSDSIGNVYRFSSKEVNLNSGIYYYGYRFYEPTLQRWLNRDPLAEEGGLNLYEFVENEPTIFFDPDGGKPMTLPKLPPLPPGIKPPLPLGPIGAAITCGAIGAAAIDVGSKLYYDEKKERCDREWDDAFKMCKEELSKPNPSRGITGGYNNVMDCARGLVSEECGGNPVDHGKKKKKPRTIRF